MSRRFKSKMSSPAIAKWKPVEEQVTINLDTHFGIFLGIFIFEMLCVLVFLVERGISVHKREGRYDKSVLLSKIELGFATAKQKLSVEAA